MGSKYDDDRQTTSWVQKAFWSAPGPPKFRGADADIRYEAIELANPGTPQFDKSNGTKFVCIASLFVDVIIGIAFLVLGSLADGSSSFFVFNTALREFLPLIINLVVLFVTESLGYIHAISLRWALFYEDRLEFNTNLRLLTFAKRSFPNGRLCNGIFFVCIAMCYAASPLILIQNTYQFNLTDGGTSFQDAAKETSLSRVIPICLGVAILVQCCLSAWCIWGSKIPSWSSDPLNTMAVAMAEGFTHTDGRCMMSVHDRRKTSCPTLPQAKQKSAYAANRKVVWALAGPTLALVALVVWISIIIPVGSSNKYGGSWGFIPTATISDPDVGEDTSKQTLSVFLGFFTKNIKPGDPLEVPETTMAGILFFCMGIQAVITIGLHCVELQTNLSRDEHIWRTLASRTGSVPNTVYNSVTMPLKSWQSMGLLVFKPVIHWLYGCAMQVDYATGIVMRVPHVTYLTILWVFLVGFAITVALHKPKGPLPATYGHIRTMIDLVDVWSHKMYWGDKGAEGDSVMMRVRRAGTSDRPLPRIDMDSLYGGLGESSELRSA